MILLAKVVPTFSCNVLALCLAPDSAPGPGAVLITGSCFVAARFWLLWRGPSDLLDWQFLNSGATAVVVRLQPSVDGIQEIH